MIHRRIILGMFLLGLSACFVSLARETAESKQALIAVIPIEGEITDMTLQSLRRRVALAQEQGAGTIVISLNTPGGILMSTFEICRFLQQLPEKTIAWVNPSAYSAGAMISLACNRVVMAPQSMMGACAPIVINPLTGSVEGLDETERAKAQSPVVRAFLQAAERHHFPPVLGEAMVKIGPAIYQVRNASTGETRYLRESELEALGLKSADLRSSNGKPVVSGDWSLLKQVLAENELLTVGENEAVEYGIAEKVISDKAGLKTMIGDPDARMFELSESWSEHLAAWLVSPGIRTILIAILGLSFYMELQTPGLGLAGAVALGALVVLLGAPYLAGLADMVEILLVIGGFGLIAVELLLTPGMIIPGLIGLILVFVGLVMSFVPSDPGPGWLPTLPGSLDMLSDGIKAIFGAILATGIGIFVLARYFGVIPVLKYLVLQTASAPMLGEEVRAGAWAPQVGQIGTAASMLRPVGLADFDQQRVDVQTAGEPIEAGRRIRVVQVTGNRIVVAEA